MRALVTGGAGFIGSHLVDRLVADGWEVTVLDNMSAGTRKNLAGHRNGKGFRTLEGDCTRAGDVDKALKRADVVFHLAANPEVRLQLSDPVACFRQNVYATYILLERMRTSSAESIVFTSTSTVYGEPSVIPTPENYGPLKPISLYGGSKLACEALISSYCHSFDRRGLILRLANTVGDRSTHGVIADFISKLRKDPTRLEVLGDGTQVKSYIHYDDCISGIIKAFETSSGRVEILNVGSEDRIGVSRIAEVVIKGMGLKETVMSFTGGVDGGRGWVGDVKEMLLDVGKLKSRGWSPLHDSEESVRLAARSMIEKSDRKGSGRARGLRDSRRRS